MQIYEELVEMCIRDRALLEDGAQCSYVHVGLPNTGVTHATTEQLRAKFSLDAASLRERLRAKEGTA